MKETPTGWGSGYINIDSVTCRKLSSKKIKCALKAVLSFSEQKEKKYTQSSHLKKIEGSKVRFEHLTLVEQFPDKITAYTVGKMACYIDSGIITCLPEKELK